MYLRAVKENASLNVRKVDAKNVKLDVNLANANVDKKGDEWGATYNGEQLII
jgi:hypothetical protein